VNETGPAAHVLVRVWLPDRPGALGQVASRIGAVRGDIIGVDVLECDGGIAIDEFAVNLAHADLVPMLVREIEEVDGASIEEVRVVGHFPDPRLDALESAARLAQVKTLAELHRALAAQVCEEFLAEWAAVGQGWGEAAVRRFQSELSAALDQPTTGLSAWQRKEWMSRSSQRGARPHI